MLAAKTTVPVLGVPVASRAPAAARIRCYSIVQMPSGVPVATFAIGEAGAANAALFAVAMLAADDPRLRRRARASTRGPRDEQRRRDRCRQPRRRDRRDRSRRRRSACSAAASSAGCSCIAARTMGYRTSVLDPDRDSPAGAVADDHIAAAYDDAGGARRGSAATCAGVTTEFENAPAAGARRASPTRAAGGSVRRRRRRSPRTASARRRFLAAAGVPVAPYAVIERAEELAASPDASAARHPEDRAPGLRRQGAGRASPTRAELARPGTTLGGVPCVLEQLLPLDGEVLGDRRPRRATARSRHYPVRANLPPRRHPRRHRGARRPCRRREAQRAGAERDRRRRWTTSACWRRVLRARDGRLLVNEMAPRPHNSGHWTLDACVDQPVRAAGARAVRPAARRPALTHAPAAMVNLLGDLWADGEPRLAGPPCWPTRRATLHLYGKPRRGRGRKMGHLTVTAAEPARGAGARPGDLASAGR